MNWNVGCVLCMLLFHGIIQNDIISLFSIRSLLNQERGGGINRRGCVMAWKIAFLKRKKRIILHPVFLLRLQYFNLIDVLIDRTYMFWLINSFQNYKLEFYRYTISIRKFPQRVTKDKKSIMTHYFFSIFI